MCVIEFELLIGSSVTLMPVTWWFFFSSLDIMDYVRVHFSFRCHLKGTSDA